MTTGDTPVKTRVGIPITRTHQRFLLRSLHFIQQFASMYRCRYESLYPHVLSALNKLPVPQPAGGSGTVMASSLPYCRLLELNVGRPARCIGTVYKQMGSITTFLSEYQKELIRIDAGDGDDDDGEGMPVENFPPAEGDAGPLPTGAETSAGILCRPSDVLILEDDSGRVELHGIDPGLLCTGVILGVCGELRDKGRLHVVNYTLSGPGHWIPRPSVTESEGPRYIAFVSGLSIGGGDVSSWEPSSALETLLEFLSGNAADPHLQQIASRIGRLVIGGDSIAETEEYALKDKVKLDPSDHTRMNDPPPAGVLTVSALMRRLDHVLAQIAGTIDVELMPGNTDPSNAFLPQQPMHPMLLPTASRMSTLKLVTNPMEFTTKTEEATEQEGVHFFVTSGQNVSDVARQTTRHQPEDVLRFLFDCGDAFPTAPNSLTCYPFEQENPFQLRNAPHCMVACNQSAFATCWDSHCPSEAADAFRGVRHVLVPTFAETSQIVLVDVNSVHLDTTTVCFD